MPVIQARPDIAGTIAALPPTVVSASIAQSNREPMIERPVRCRAGVRAQGRDVMAAGRDIGQDRLAAGGDDFHESLMNAHDGLSFEQSAALNARLVLLLANRVGDADLLESILDAAAGRSGDG